MVVFGGSDRETAPLFWPPEASRVRLLEASFMPDISCASCEAAVHAWASAFRSACHMSLSKKEAWGAPPVSAEKKSPVPRGELDDVFILELQARGA